MNDFFKILIEDIKPDIIIFGHAELILEETLEYIKRKNIRMVYWYNDIPLQSYFRNVEFDDLENFLSPYGDDNRGYLLDEVSCNADGKLDDLDDLPEFNGTIIYHADPVLQFNSLTNQAKQLERDDFLRGSAQFSVAARISDGDKVEVTFGSTTIQREFKLDSELKGTIALNPTFDMDVDASRYRFEKSKIVRVVE